LCHSLGSPSPFRRGAACRGRGFRPRSAPLHSRLRQTIPIRSCAQQLHPLHRIRRQATRLPQ
jgi:hypothetical protein